MNKTMHKKPKTLVFGILLLTLLFGSFLAGVPMNYNPSDNLEDNTMSPVNNIPETSDVYQVGDKYDLDEWWNTSFRYRIGIEIEELDGIDRYQPIELYLEFDENEYYKGTERLVAYYGPGSWSDPIPVQVWNDFTYSETNFIDNCSITFLAQVAANSNQTYFLYYNENDENIDTNFDYGTDFSSQLVGGTTLTVNVRGDSGSDYKVVLQEGIGVKTLEKDGIALNYHQAESLAPEKQLTLSSLRFLAHMDENSGNRVYDSTGNVLAGGLIYGATWGSGIVKYGLHFDGLNDYVDFGAALEDPGDPFDSATTKWTMTAWIKPDDITSDTSQTNHGTRNCFMAKASDPINDNFEIGVNADGSIHLYLDTVNRDTQFDFRFTGTVTVDEWNFIALRVDFTKSNNKVELRVNDGPWEPTPSWDTATRMDNADGSLFTIGSTDHTNNYFEGSIDEVAFYNTPLSDEDIETYKYLSNPSVIEDINELEKGQVFSRYQIDWTETFDMHVSDIATFYWDYNLWHINRSIYFDGQYLANESAMIPLNTHYDFSLINDHDQCRYIYDGNIDIDITDPDFISENYTVVYNYPDATKDAIGVFIANYSLSNDMMSMSYFNGSTNYYDNNVDFTPGVNSDLDNSGGTSLYTLYVQFYEFVDSVAYTNDNALKWYFENVSVSLKEPINAYIYDKESRFYNLRVYIEDHDGRPVPEATIAIWNNTASESSYKWLQDTDETGWTTFERFDNGTFVINASYVRYGQELSITTSQTIIDLSSIVDVSGTAEIQFLDVSLTSIVLNCSRFDTGVYQGPLTGAKLNFTYDDGTGPVVFNGYESTNSTGAAVFRWTNTTSSGNVTFSIEWFGYPQFPISTPLDKMPSDITKICLDFSNYAWHNVSVEQGSDYESDLELFDDGLQDKQLNQNLFVWVNYSYTVDGLNPTGIIDATVKLDLKIGTQVINQNPIYLSSGIGDGNYSKTFDTSQPIEVGGANWLSGITYTVVITASKPGFDAVIETTDITLLDLTARLNANESKSYANWNEMLTFEVHYEYDNFGLWSDINNADVEYYVLQAPEVFGTLTWIGTGLYRASISSTEFPGTDEYDIMITASLQNYETKTIRHEISILEIRTFLNNSLAIFQDENVYFEESRIFYFNYTVATTGIGLSGAEEAEFDWEMQDDLGNRILVGYNVPLTDMGNGIYALDFDTENLGIGTYIFDITIKKENYEDRRATLYLYLIKRDFSTDAKKIYKVVSGKSLTITLNIRDFKTSELLDIDNAYVTFQGQNFQFIGSGGVYTAKITNIPDAFIMPETISASITIIRDNYTTTVVDISIVVEMVEIFPGMPLFYFLMIVVAVGAVVGSLVTYRYVQQKRIPTFVKKARAMKSDIKGRKAISDSLLYPSKEEYIVKKFGDKWEMLGLSLEDLLGLEDKKRKKMAEIKEEYEEFEGGGI